VVEKKKKVPRMYVANNVLIAARRGRLVNAASRIIPKNGHCALYPRFAPCYLHGEEAQRSMRGAKVMRCGSLILLQLFLVSPGYSQLIETQPHFEVASFKLLAKDAPFDRGIPSWGAFYGGRVRLPGYSLTTLLTVAYDVKEYLIVRPAWMDTTYYSVLATMPISTPRKEVNLMLQTLLAERLGLTAHREERQGSMYALYVEPHGPKCPIASGVDPETKEPPFVVRNTGSARRIIGNATIAQLIRQISIGLDAPLVDKTGLGGSYSIDLSWGPSEFRDATGDAIASPHFSRSALLATYLAEALQKQLGLRMRAEKGALEMVVVEGSRREPIDQ